MKADVKPRTVHVVNFKGVNLNRCPAHDVVYRAERSTDANWPRAMNSDAYHGLTGRVVDYILPQTESDPANVLVSFLVAFGNSIGRTAHYRIEDTKHYANEYAVIVGPTAGGRKGTGFDRVKAMFDQCEEASTANVSWVGCISRIGLYAVGELVGIDGGVVSGVINLELSGVEASDWRPRHDERYHEA